jgi:hypothetical protein
VWPNRSGKDGGKDSNNTGEGDRQGEHGPPFGIKRTQVSLPIKFNSNGDKWTKWSSFAHQKYGYARKSTGYEDLNVIWKILITLLPPLQTAIN